jgi:hypothetical protein
MDYKVMHVALRAFIFSSQALTLFSRERARRNEIYQCNNSGFFCCSEIAHACTSTFWEKSLLKELLLPPALLFMAFMSLLYESELCF